MQDWLKLHTDLLDNPDVALMSAEDYQIATFMWMLCRKEGFNDGRMVGWNYERLAYRFRKSVEVVRHAVIRLSQPDLKWCAIECNGNAECNGRCNVPCNGACNGACNGVVTIPRYMERQYGTKSSQPASVRERVKRHRNKQKEAKQVASASENVTRNGDVTGRNAVEENREEEKRVENGVPPQPPSPPHSSSNHSSNGNSPPAKSKKEQTGEPVAILLLRTITGTSPPAEHWETLCQIVKDKAKDDLEPYFLQWLKVSKNRDNWTWVLEWFASGRPATDFGPKVNHGNRPTDTQQPSLGNRQPPTAARPRR